MTALSPIEEKGGHRLYRAVREEFRPWCAICKGPVLCQENTDGATCGEWHWHPTEASARGELHAHVRAEHPAHVGVVEGAVP